MKKVFIIAVVLFLGVIIRGYVAGGPQVESFKVVVVQEGQEWGDFIGEEYAEGLQLLNPTVKELKAGVEVQVPVFKK